MRSRARTSGIAVISLALLGSTLLAVPRAASAADDDRPATRPEKIERELASSFKADDTQEFWVKLAPTADNTAARHLADWDSRGAQVAANLREVADRSQAPVRARLDAAGVEYDTFWITNAIRVLDGDRQLALELTADPAVATVVGAVRFEQDEPFDGVEEPKVGAVEWGVADINADDFWSEYGVSGEGVVVANIDTGVDYTHPALVEQYRGNLGGGSFDHDYSWFDPTGSSVVPTDGDAHGTHTMGTIVGSDGGANQIGVAPGATWIASNALMSTPTDFLVAMEWMLEPTDLQGENPDASKRPNIISNSWGVAGVPTDPFGDDIQQAWIDSGIFGTWSNRNLGPRCDSTGSPGGRALSYSNGAYDIDHRIAGFSSRGPGQDGMIKPNIAGPGVNVRSAVPGGGYESLSGTSMSTPHLAGAVALLWSAAPALVGDVEGTRAILDQSAIDTDATRCGGTVENNNVFGEGRLDVLAAGALAPVGDTGTVVGTITDQEGDPVGDAEIIFEGEHSRTTTTDEDGTYGVTLATGSYDVSVEAFGHEPEAGVVEVTVDQETVFDATLELSETWMLVGRVRDRQTNARLAGITVRIEGTPLTTTTNARGGYTFREVPAGTYDVTAVGGGCYRSRTKEAVIDGVWPGPAPAFRGDERKRFKLGPNGDGVYTCTTGPSAYVEGTSDTGLVDDEALLTVDLPFAFPYYGEEHDAVELSTNGHLRFVPSADFGWSNAQIPSETPPNGVVAPLWDDLVIDATSGVRTASGDRTFTVEYRDALLYGGAGERVDFSVTLHDDGRIVMSYRGIDPASDLERGSSATVGIEDLDGSRGVQYAFNQVVLSDDVAITFRPVG